MANDLNNGAERLLSRILADAAALVKDQEQAAQAEVDKIKELAARDVKKAQQEAKAACDRAEADILERSRTNAELDARKYALKSKRTVMEGAFSAALNGLVALNGQERDTLLTNTAVCEAAGGETVCPAATDAENMKRLLPAINGALQKNGKAALVLGEPAKSVGTGFLLCGEGFEKDCSFEAMLHEVRELEESVVAQILFE